MLKSSIVFAAVLSASLAAQTATCIYVPDNSASTGTANVIPFGNAKSSTTWRNQKYQMLVPASFAKGKPILIRDLAFPPSTTNVHNFTKITIRMAMRTASTLDRSFAKNLITKPATVLSAKNYTWYLKSNTWCMIGLQKPYLWIPQTGNLVIDIETEGSGGLGTTTTGGFHRSTSIERLYAFGWTSKPPASGQSTTSLAAVKVALCSTLADASPFGLGCKGSAGVPALAYTGSPKLGSSFTMTLSNAKTNSAAIHVLGFQGGSLTPFPIDLSAAGAPGCALEQSIDSASGAATPNGSAQQTIPVPKDSSLIGARFYSQWFVLDAGANKLGLVGSNYGRVLIGL